MDAPCARVSEEETQPAAARLLALALVAVLARLLARLLAAGRGLGAAAQQHTRAIGPALEPQLEFLRAAVGAYHQLVGLVDKGGPERPRVGWRSQASRCRPDGAPWSLRKRTGAILDELCQAASAAHGGARITSTSERSIEYAHAHAAGATPSPPASSRRSTSPSSRKRTLLGGIARVAAGNATCTVHTRSGESVHGARGNLWKRALLRLVPRWAAECASSHTATCQLCDWQVL